MALAVTDIRDAGLREAYRKAIATSSTSGSTITARELAAVIRSTFDGKKITTTEEKDLDRILKDAQLSARARVNLNQFIANRKAMTDDGLFRMTDSETAWVARTVCASFHTGRISFEDPATKHQYHPHMYQDVARLIRLGVVECFWHDQSWDIEARTYRGLYKSTGNRLVVAVSKRLGVHRESTIVHEATHCIQDMADMRIGRQYAEAAAHLAQAIMLIERDGGGEDYLYDRVADMAAQAKKVLKGDALTLDDWNGIIDAIKEAYPTNDIINFARDGGTAKHFYEEAVKFLLTESW